MQGKLEGDEWWIIDGWDQRLFDSWALGLVLKGCFDGHATPPPLAQDFISKLMKRDASQRMSISEALNHKWLQTKKTTGEDLFK